MKNHSEGLETTDGNLLFTEVVRQEYAGNNCIFSAGFVEGHPIDTMYIRLEKDGVEPTVILLRPDEMACIAWLASGTLWSQQIEKVPNEDSKALP